MVTGDLVGGKLGLGKAWASGIIMSFKEITALNEVKQIACGPNHMLAIAKGIEKDNKGANDGKPPANILYAWGGNWKCQLGIDTKDNQYEPTLVFKKMA
jgi:alpha-tubulin suppressor-like RCC1 family protein